MDHAADESRSERLKLTSTQMIKPYLLLLVAAATFCLGGCADGIEPDREVKAASHSPDFSGNIPRTNDTPARQSGF